MGETYRPQHIPMTHALLASYARSADHPKKLRVERWLARNVLQNRLLVRLSSGLHIEVDPSEWIGRNIVLHGTYEPRTLDLITRIMAGKPGCFVDIGANIGLHALNAATVLNTERVIAFEPILENHQRLVKNFYINGLGGKLVSFLAPLSDRNRFVTLAQRKAGNAGTFAIEHVAAQHFQQLALPLAAVLGDLDESISIACIKIDVEGHELEVIRGIDFSGGFRPKNLIVEWSNGNDEEVYRMLTSHGYQMLDVSGKQTESWRDILLENNAWFRDNSTFA
jgi:FkbM family methyltransferase